MNKSEIFEIVTCHAREVIPALSDHEFKHSDALRNLGANSIDRSEIVMMSLESCSLNIPLIETVRAQSIGELVDILYERSESA